ncbi:MAG: ABC transporter ATP-binding protein [Mycobacteriaceae bacterium]
MIEYQAVTKRYADGTTAVDELNLTVEDGGITVLVGPSGCGKTTSLRMINRMVEPTSGSILLDGVDIMSGPSSTLRRGIGYVIQQAGLFPHRTVLDNVATVPVLTGQSKRVARTRAAELLETVGLGEDIGHRYPSQLSGGQQQRVGVARALAADPPVLLMDEPFSAVDPETREHLQDELLRLQAELGKTIVFVTHDIDEAVRLGDKVAVFRQGGVLAQYDTPAEILARPADDFVASFVGRDRGYRGLSFTAGDGLELAQLDTLDLGGTALPATVDSWVLATDDGRPAGWLPPGSPVERALLVPGGSLHPANGPLRSALDAALSSPSGLGVVVDGDGRTVGSVGAATVLEHIEAARAREMARVVDTQPGAGQTR